MIIAFRVVRAEGLLSDGRRAEAAVEFATLGMAWLADALQGDCDLVSLGNSRHSYHLLRVEERRREKHNRRCPYVDSLLRALSDARDMSVELQLEWEAGPLRDMPLPFEITRCPDPSCDAHLETDDEHDVTCRYVEICRLVGVEPWPTT